MLSPMTYCRRLRLLALAWCWAVLAGIASATPFSELVVFGDSLSDVGNVAQASFDIFPGQFYYNDRFSNGPVWVESLSVGLGLGAIAPSTAGGGNFSYGGAQTTGTSGLPGMVILDLDEQVTAFLGSRIVDPEALFVVFAGSNDLVDGNGDAMAPVASLAQDLGRLIAAGARQFLVPNLPSLGFTPRYNGDPESVADYNAQSAEFNAGLDAAIDALAAGNQELTFFRLDVESLFSHAIADPAAYGLTNVVAPAAPGLQPGFATYNASLIAPNAHEYLFWDDLHPTATVHAVLAQRALTLLLDMPGDFDANGIVDEADLARWKLGYGATGAANRHRGDADGDRDVDGADLLAWQRQFGLNINAPPPVPEPPGLAIMLLLAGGLRCARPRRLVVTRADADARAPTAIAFGRARRHSR